MSINIKMFQRTTNYKPNTKKGFSLFELLVVLSIASVVTVVSFSSFPKMNGKLSLDLLAQDIALTLRQAQVYGTTVMGAGDVDTQIFQSYGVSFPDPNMPLPSSEQYYKYVLFADLSPYNSNPEQTRLGFYNEEDKKCMEDYSNCSAKICGSPGVAYDVDGENECVQRFSVTGRDKIKAFCLNYINESTNNNAVLPSGEFWDKKARVTECLRSDSTLIKQPDSGTTVDITYKRPKMQASIETKVLGNSCSSIQGCSQFEDSIQNVGIVVEGESGETRVVVVWTNGQIAVER